VDIISPDISQPWHTTGAIINEVNFAPLLGGGEISRAHIGEYLARLIDGDGRIPVHVYVGGKAAWEAGLKRQASLLAEGIEAIVTNDTLTLDHQGHPIHMPLKSLADRANALVLSRQTKAIILVIQNGGLLASSLPLESVESVSIIDDETTENARSNKRISSTNLDILKRCLIRWQSQKP
jgi:cyanophycin synthetase